MPNISKSIKAVIFDVDGVLINSVPYHFRAWKKTFALFDISLTYADYQQYLNGLPRSEGIRRVLHAKKVQDTELPDIIAQAKQKRYLLSIDGLPPKPLAGVIPFLSYLNLQQIPTAAASSSKNARYLIEKTGLHRYFSVVIGGGDFTKPKPDPDIFLTAAARLGVIPSECMVIEDAVVGAQAGRAMHAYTVGLLTSLEVGLRTVCHLTIPSLSKYKKLLPLLDS